MDLLGGAHLDQYQVQHASTSRLRVLESQVCARLSSHHHSLSANDHGEGSARGPIFRDGICEDVMNHRQQDFWWTKVRQAKLMVRSSIHVDDVLSWFPRAS